MKKAILTLALLTGAVAGTRAGIILSDDFNYPDGGIVANSTWIANTGTAGTMLVSNNTLLVSTARTEDITHTLAGWPYLKTGAVPALYSSYTLKCVGLPTVIGTYFSHFTGTNVFHNGAPNLSGFRARMWASTSNEVAAVLAGPTQFYLSIANSGLSGITNAIQTAPWATPLETNTTYTIVTKYELATGTSTLWVNPAAETDTHVVGTDPVPNDTDPVSGWPTNGPIDISCYSFRQATGEGTMVIDNLRVGTRFADVAGNNQSPSISSIPDQSIAANASTGPIAFTVSDPETPAAELTVSNTTDNATLVKISDVTFGGSGANRTVTVTPEAGKQGTANITVYVSDSVNVSFTTFKVQVGFPSISAIPNQIIYSNLSTGPIAFTVSDHESPAGSLNVIASSAYPSLVAPGDITLGGSGANRTISLKPEADQTGFAVITLAVDDGQNTNTTSFVLTVRPNLGILLSDSFDYPDGALLYNGPWLHGSGTFGDLQVVSGTAQLSGALTEDLAAAWTTAATYAPASGVVLYAGYQVTFTGIPTYAGNYFTHFKDSITGTAFHARVFAKTNGVTPGCFRIGIANYTGVSAQYPRDLSLNQPYQVVTKYNVATGESWLWINPSDETSPSLAATDKPFTDSVGAYGLRQDTDYGTNYIDNLVVSTSFADVVPTLTRPALQLEVSGGAGTLTWTGSPLFTVQSSTNLAGPWTDLPGVTSPYPIPSGVAQQFFRLKY